MKDKLDKPVEQMFNSRINMMLFDNILELEGLKHLTRFKMTLEFVREDKVPNENGVPLDNVFEIDYSQIKRATQFRQGYYTNDHMKTIHLIADIDMDYYDGVKRFIVPKLEEAIDRKEITYEIIDNELHRKLSEYYMPSELTIDYMKEIYQEYKRSVTHYDYNLFKLIYLIKNKSVKGLVGISRNIKDLNDVTIEKLSKINTEHLQLYVEALENQAEIAKAILSIRRFRDMGK